MPNFDLGKFFQSATITFFKNRAIKDPQFLSDLMTSILNPYFDQITEQNFIDGYEQKVGLLQQVEPHYGKLADITQKIGLKKSEMKEIYEKYMPEFKIAWIYTWFSRDHPPLYAAMVNYIPRAEMENYVVHECRKVAEHFLNHVLH